MADRSDAPILVLSSRKRFERLVGPVPEGPGASFLFAKPNQSVRIGRAIGDCSLLITKSYPRPDVNRWVFEARRRGVPTLLLIDGPLEWANLYSNPSLAARGVDRLFEPIVHDAVASVGRAQAAWVESRNPGRGLQHMTYRNHRISAPDGLGVVGGERAFDFLLTAAKTPYFSDEEKQDLVRVLEHGADALARGGHRVLVRLFDPDLRRAVESRIPAATFSTEGAFSTALETARCVIGAPSSVLLEAMASGRATAMLVFRDAPLHYQAGWLLGPHVDWRASLEEMLKPTPERMAYQRQVVLDNVAEGDFYEESRTLLASHGESMPRPLDELDLAFENRVLRNLLGWPGRAIASLATRLSNRRSGR